MLQNSNIKLYLFCALIAIALPNNCSHYQPKKLFYLIRIMEYVVEFKPRALKDLKSLQPDISEGIIAKIEQLQYNLSGDIKKLTNFTPEYRLRVGQYRVLFEIEGNQVLIYRIKHRSEAYS